MLIAYPTEDSLTMDLLSYLFERAFDLTLIYRDTKLHFPLLISIKKYFWLI